MNKRDERGWRIPREGTRSHAIYLLMVQGLSNNEIAKRLGFEPSGNKVRVLACHIKRPNVHNATNIRYYQNHPELRKKFAKVNYRKTKYFYTPYVRKLVKVLGISYKEALEHERKLLEKSE